MALHNSMDLTNEDSGGTVCILTLADTQFSVNVSLDSLAQHSGYFAELQDKCVQKTPAPQRLRIELPADSPLTAEGIQAFVKFVLGEQISIGHQELPVVLQAAVYFQSTALIDLCEKSLLNFLNSPETVIAALNMAIKLRKLISADTFDTVIEYGANHIDVIHEHLSSATPQTVEAVLSRDELNVGCETEAFDIALSYLKTRPYDAPYGAEAAVVFSAVRFTLMSTVSLIECISKAKQDNLETHLLPFVKQADWHRTCIEFGRPDLSHLAIRPRKAEFQQHSENRSDSHGNSANTTAASSPQISEKQRHRSRTREKTEDESATTKQDRKAATGSNTTYTKALQDYCGFSMITGEPDQNKAQLVNTNQPEAELAPQNRQIITDTSQNRQITETSQNRQITEETSEEQPVFHDTTRPDNSYDFPSTSSMSSYSPASACFTSQKQN